MGKASDLKAKWQFSFFILPILIFGIMALPARGIAHDIEMKFLLISVVFIAYIVKSEIDKRRFPSLALYFNHVQSIMLAIMFMIILLGLIFLLGYQFKEWFGEKNIFYPLTIASLYFIVCFLIIWRNPSSVQYVPWILILPHLVATLVGDFDKAYLALWILIAIASTAGYYAGSKRLEKHKRLI